MRTHAYKIFGFEPYDLGTKLADLRYDSLLLLLCGLKNQIVIDSEKDADRGNVLLSTKLIELSESLDNSISIMKSISDMCHSKNIIDDDKDLIK
jgi:hypothetical protein